jgi:hypothetical protein
MLNATFPVIKFPHLEQARIPRVARVSLVQPAAEAIADITAAVNAEIAKSRRLAALPKGASVAVGLGSRGIANIPMIARAVIDRLKAMGLAPFVVPAMGSHGGGTADGQRAVLARLGMTEEFLGAPVKATMEVASFGKSEGGFECKFDKFAAEADAVVVVNRIKSHTSFDRPNESGIVKMVAVGLGKAEGARVVHRLGVAGMAETLPELARTLLERAPVAFGIALVENANKDTARIVGVEPEDFFDVDRDLLVYAKSLTARLPIDTVDTLVVEQIGKDISGIGMDNAVTGRVDMRGLDNVKRPFMAKIAVLGLSAATGGNGLGIGLADFTTNAVVEKIDLQSIYMNSLTSTLVEKSRIPIVLPNDRDAVAAAVVTSWSATDELTRLCLIRSTLHLDEMVASESMVEELRGNPKVGDIGPFFELEFSRDGQLLTRAYRNSG